MHSICLFIYGWFVVESLNLNPNNLIKALQNLLVNSASCSLIISSSSLNYFTTFLKERSPACFIMHGCGATMKIAYFKNFPTITKIELKPLTLRKPKVKSIETNTFSFLAICNGCNSLTSFHFSCLSS